MGVENLLCQRKFTITEAIGSGKQFRVSAGDRRRGTVY